MPWSRRNRSKSTLLNSRRISARQRSRTRLGATLQGSRVRRARGFTGGVPHAGDDLVERQQRGLFDLQQQRIEIAHRRRHFAFGGDRREIAGDKGHLGIRLCRRRRLVGIRHSVGEQLLRIERRNVGGNFRKRQCKIAGDPYKGARSHQFALTDSRTDRHPNDLACDARFADGGDPIGLVNSAQAAGERSAQRQFDALRRQCEIRFAVERSINGAPHQGGAAQTGQDRAGEPLNGEPAPVDQTASPPINRKRRFIAEIDRLGVEPPICAAQPSLVQDHGSPALAIASDEFAPSPMIWTAHEPHRASQVDRTAKVKHSLDSGAPPHCASPTRPCKERRRNVAAVRRGHRECTVRGWHPA